jgi:hypothetical protein
MSVESCSATSCWFLISLSVRVTVSRDVPMSSAISSWVSDSLIGFPCLVSWRVGGPVQKEASQLFRSGSRQTDSSQLLAGSAVERAQLLRHTLVCLGMFGDKAQEVVAKNEGRHAGMEGFGCFLVAI